MAERPNESAATVDFEFSALNQAHHYRAALVQEFAPALTGRVLEIGAGIGQITSGLLTVPGLAELVAVEPEPRFCARFREQHPSLRLIEGTIDGLNGDHEWNAIVSINVLEHIREDEVELRRYREHLAPRRGRLCLFVPARQEIYAPIDRDFGHFRRYARPELRRKLEQAGFTIERLHYFNAIGYAAWWWTFCLLKNRGFNAGAVSFFDHRIFPIMWALERKVARPPFGQSLLAVARA